MRATSFFVLGLLAAAVAMAGLATNWAAAGYVFLGAFVIGMLLTPPDVISQTLLAVPVYLLYEAGIVMSRVVRKKPENEPEPSEIAGVK